jgi:hypothetical protein
MGRAHSHPGSQVPLTLREEGSGGRSSRRGTRRDGRGGVRVRGGIRQTRKDFSDTAGVRRVSTGPYRCPGASNSPFFFIVLKLTYVCYQETKHDDSCIINP